jgi:hypothetical protein
MLRRLAAKVAWPLRCSGLAPIFAVPSACDRGAPRFAARVSFTELRPEPATSGARYDLSNLRCHRRASRTYDGRGNHYLPDVRHIQRFRHGDRHRATGET